MIEQFHDSELEALCELAKEKYKVKCAILPREAKLSVEDIGKPQQHCHCSVDTDVRKISDYLNMMSSGNKFYPTGGFLAWHTDDVGTRVYCSYAYGGGCWFRYQDPKTKEIVTLDETIGWNFKKFTITKDVLLWHCVYAGSERLTFGFKEKKCYSGNCQTTNT
jgi:hypothetical protein